MKKPKSGLAVSISETVAESPAVAAAAADLPPLADAVPDQISVTSDAEPEEPTDIPPETPEKIVEGNITIPLGSYDSSAFRPRHLDVQLNQPQSIALKRLANALDRRGEKLANGRRIVNTNDAAKWLFERIGDLQ